MDFFNTILTTKNLADYKDEALSETEIRHPETNSVETYSIPQDYEPDVILAQAFGESEDAESYNETLAQNLLAAREFYGDIPVVAQAEVVNCLEEIDKLYDLGLDFNDDVYRVFETSGKSEIISDHPTTRVLEQASSVMDQNDITRDKALLTGHPAHMERIMYAADKSGVAGEPFVRSDVSWPENDGQEWVRNPESWKKRELASRAHHWIHYNVPGADELFERLEI